MPPKLYISELNLSVYAPTTTKVNENEMHVKTQMFTIYTDCKCMVILNIHNKQQRLKINSTLPLLTNVG
jgi:hypothetical protein